MTTKSSQPRPIDIKAGVQPATDATASSTSHYTYTEGVRFNQGLPEKIGGWMRQNFDYGATLSGVTRTLFTDTVAGKDYLLLGTNSNLYAQIGSRLSDISPVGLASGRVDEGASQGYGAGLYGIGLYGTALVSNLGRLCPRIWFVDRFANSFVMTPGNQNGLYQWFGDVLTKPVLVENAPTNINYAFVSNNIIVTFGAENIENRIFSSDFDINVWTSSSTNQVYDDDIEGAGRLTSHCPAQDTNLIFTTTKTYTFRYIGLPNVWEILPLDDKVGIIAPMARVSVNGDAFWMSLENFHVYRGGRTQVIPANTQDESTALRYVFDDLNYGQKSKIFAWYNPRYKEVWYHYPSANSNECDRVIRVNLSDFSWSIDKLPRTAGEYPSVKTPNPYLANSNILYKHELGVNADQMPLSFNLIGPRLYNGKSNLMVTGFIPDSIQTNDINFTVTGYRYPQSVMPTDTKTEIVTPNTEFFQSAIAARYYQYQWQGNALDQDWRMGTWFDDVQSGPTQ